MNTYKGRLLKLESIGETKRKWSKDCNIVFPNKIPVTYNFFTSHFFTDVYTIIGHAMIEKDDDGLICIIMPNGTYDFNEDIYYVGGGYVDVRSHKEGDIIIIDSCRLVNMAIIPKEYVDDSNLIVYKEKKDE